ncbi:MAG: hypothetical protein F4X03_12935 [Dehalococcoidia bacterium]|nr:hypothetical protein [Dehalococcoidia bacterium]MYD29795.1 hypothetical protein [Dehalococcoidia bacterium]
MGNKTDPAHIRSIDTWESGGGIELDIVELVGGMTLVVADETVAIYPSVDEFWAEAEDGYESHRTTTLLRETGQPFALTGSA